MTIQPGDILFLHGLEGSPQGHKGTWLREHYGAHAPALDTRAARDAVARFALEGTRWRWRPEDVELALRSPMLQALEALARQPRRLIIGSSFGGALLVELIHQGHWRGPTILLAAAAAKMHRRRALPLGLPAVLIHGRQDQVVPIADSRNLAADSGAGVALWEVDGDHGLGSILTDGTLAKAIALLLEDRRAG